MKKIIFFFLSISTFVFGQTPNDYVISDNYNSFITTPNTTFYSRVGHVGISNVAVGSGVLMSNTLGNKNVGLGHNSLNGNIAGSENVAVGAGSNEFGIGYGVTSINTQTSGQIGNNGNVSVGYKSLNNNRYSSRNVAIGINALSTQTGRYSLPFGGVTGDYNIAVGAEALKNSVSGTGNIAIGTEAMFSYNYQTVGFSSGHNISVGHRSMYLVGPLVRNNIAIGQESLYKNNGSENIAIGDYALYNSLSGTRNIAIGGGAGFNETANNKLYIENSNSNTPLIGGDFTNDIVGINTPMANLATNPTWKLQVGGDINSTGVVRAAGVALSSDIRFKKNIRPLQNSLANISKINGVSYDWRKDEFKDRSFTDKSQVGLIAQEVEKIYPEMIDIDVSGYKSINYTQFTPILIEAIKELNQKVDKLEYENKNLLSLIKRIKNLENTNSMEANSKRK